MSLDYGSRTSTPSRVVRPEEIQRRQIIDAANAAIQQVNARHMQEIAALRSQRERERQELNQKLKSLNSLFADSIRRHQKQLSELREQYNARLTSLIVENEKKRQQDRMQLKKELDEAMDIVNANVEDLRQSTQSALDATNQSIKELRIETQQRLNGQQQQINNIVEEVHNDKTKAAAIKQALRLAYDEQRSILQIKEHEKYAPRQLAAIDARLANIDSLPDAAACAVLNTEFNNLLTLDADIEQKKMEYETKHLLTLKAVEEVLARMNENRKTVSLTDGNGNVIKKADGEIALIELDFWTEGKYGELEKDLETIKERVTRGLHDTSFTVDDLDEALQRIQEIDQQQNELVIESIKSGNASQIRAETADVIVDHLEGQRFQVVERGYENSDARNAYLVKLNDGTSEIVVVVNPESNEENLVIRRTIDTDLSEPSLIRMNEDIDKVLREIGLSTQGGCCQKSDPNGNQAWREIYDMDVLGQEIPLEIKVRARLKDVRKERNENKA